MKHSGCSLWAKFGQNYVQCCKKSKETGIINRFSSYFTWGIHLKQKVVVAQTPEEKFKTNIVRNSIFEGN